MSPLPRLANHCGGVSACKLASSFIIRKHCVNEQLPHKHESDNHLRISAKRWMSVFPELSNYLFKYPPSKQAAACYDGRQEAFWLLSLLASLVLCWKISLMQHNSYKKEHSRRPQWMHASMHKQCSTIARFTFLRLFSTLLWATDRAYNAHTTWPKSEPKVFFSYE